MHGITSIQMPVFDRSGLI